MKKQSKTCSDSKCCEVMWNLGKGIAAVFEDKKHTLLLKDGSGMEFALLDRSQVRKLYVKLSGVYKD